MARAPLTFKQRDVAAAIKAAVQAGQQVDRIEIRRDGSIVVILTNGKEQQIHDKPVQETNGSDEWADLT
jgi:hypothetical protein